MFPPVFLTHTITLIHKSESGQTASGEITYTTTKTKDIKCRLFGAASRNGAGTVYAAKCYLLAGNTIAEDDMIVSGNDGFNRTYWVNSVNTVYEPVQQAISHIVLELRDTEHRREIS